MNEQQIKDILSYLWIQRRAADKINAKLRSISVFGEGGTWLFNISTDPGSKTAIFQAKFYTHANTAAVHGAQTIDTLKIFGKLSGSSDMEVALDAKYIPDSTGKCAGLGDIYKSPVVPVKSFISLGKGIQTISSQIPTILKPKNDQGCECGAFVVGAIKGDTQHSSWCPARGLGSSKKKAKEIKI